MDTAWTVLHFVLIVLGCGVLFCILAPERWFQPKRSAHTYSPRGDRVIVKQLPPQPGKQGDVLLPDSQRKPLNEGTVIAVGPAAGCSDIRVGQHVCFLDFAGSAVKIDGEDYLAMREQEIHGIRA